MTLDARSISRLKGVNPHLVAVVQRAAEISPVKFIVTEGLRTKERQAQLKAAGASTTMNSRHLTGHAVDLAAVVDGEVRWDWPLYHKLAAAMQKAANELEVPIVWGGSWKSFPDGPHFELDRRTYPA
ncbi:M15 family metallopeptidase [Caldimonas thermodepolymerans]|uniref:Peptidase M15 n=1 Tax=Caldimonas thermodepolymerans TaxID=215580 RepID=A0A2S5T8Z4_9BURK|nr:M15 family metallopeptidase [Caldimonas thermodepolymerans]PPE71480.1 peptidase M15 [Caldimonas thermodepolymerans]QPC30507.1 M15 family metallopeptidase [Caldimonas thermodepolymerans]RDI02907.1 peptidoglycan L-alanyl-D-glutamate endopeptidase CwlK [Caldimonas thermodepolymerans]